MEYYFCDECQITFDNEGELEGYGFLGLCPECGTFEEPKENSCVKKIDYIKIPIHEFKALTRKIDDFIKDKHNNAKHELARISLNTLKTYDI